MKGAGDSVRIPARLLLGIVPEVLLRSFHFWQYQVQHVRVYLTLFCLLGIDGDLILCLFLDCVRCLLYFVDLQSCALSLMLFVCVRSARC